MIVPSAQNVPHATPMVLYVRLDGRGHTVTNVRQGMVEIRV